MEDEKERIQEPKDRGMYNKSISSGHGMTVALMNSLKLWSSVQYLQKIQPLNISLLMGNYWQLTAVGGKAPFS